MFHNFLTPEECDHYIKLARPFVSLQPLLVPCWLALLQCNCGSLITFYSKPSWFFRAPFLNTPHGVQMRRSTVVGSLHAKSTVDGIRTSYGTFIK